MKVEVSQKAKIRSAINLAGGRQYYDALCLFAQVDSYESIVNRIACLCSTENITEASELYANAKTKYGKTHALYEDLAQYSGVTDLLLTLCEIEWGKPMLEDGTIRGDKSLLLRIDDLDELDDYDELLDPVFDVTADMPLFDDPRYTENRFYDVNSEEYFDSLRIRMEKCFFNDDEIGASKYAQKLLELETDHRPTLEMQLSLLLYNRKYTEAVPYLERFAASKVATPSMLHDAVEILRYLGVGNYVHLVDSFMHKAQDFPDDIALSDIEEYVYFATRYLKDKDMAYKFAASMFKDYKLLTVDQMKVCAIAFYNYGDTEKALDAAYAILRMMPNDFFAKLFIEYLRQPISEDPAPMEILLSVQRHNAIPNKIAVYVREKIRQALDSGETVLTDRLLTYVLGLIKNCKTYLAVKEYDSAYYEDFDLVYKALHTLKPEDIQQFLDIAVPEIFTSEPDKSIQAMMLECLINYGYDQKLYVSCADNKYYQFDCGKITSKDPVFIEALSVCAIYVPVEKQEKLSDAYTKLSETVEIPAERFAYERQVPFAILSILIPRFPSSRLARVFTLEERALYAQYLEIVVSASGKRNRKKDE